MPTPEIENKQCNSTSQSSLLVSVKRVLDFHFGNISLETIHAFQVKNDSALNTQNVLEILKNFRLTAIDRHMPIDSIPKHFLPTIILDSKGNSLVYLKKINDKILVFNPENEEESTVDVETLKEYTQVLLIFKDTRHLSYFDAISMKSWFYDPLKANWRTYIEVGILTVFINIFALAVPLFVMNIYNRVVPNQAYETLFVLAIGTILILIFDIVLKHVRNHILEKMSKKVGLFWEEELMRKMIFIESGFDHHSSGSKANLFKELQQIRDFFTNRSLMQIIDFPFFIIAMFVIYIISPILSSVPLIFALIIVLFNIFMQNPISQLSKNNSQNLQSKHSFIFESIQGTESIKINNAAPTRMFLWRNIVSFTDGIGIKIQSLQVLSMNVSQFILQLVAVLVLVLGVFEIANQHLSVGGLIAITMLSSRAMVPIVNLSGILIRLKEINESVSRVDEFMSLPSEDAKVAEIGIGKIDGKIEFKNVTYTFKNSKYSSIENVSFVVSPGERVGILGQTGAGKSTLMKLLVGLYAPTNGSIYLDNHDILTIHPTELRQNIGVMTQEPFLFNGTLKENIEITNPINKAKMMEIITLTGLEELVKKTGKGDGFYVGERGCNLSVGQKHLVALARVIARDPSVYILDEPTAGLDMGLEKKLVDHLTINIQRNKTLIVITHRLAALNLVDRIIVMNDGKIVADGPKDKILSALAARRGA